MLLFLCPYTPGPLLKPGNEGSFSSLCYNFAGLHIFWLPTVRSLPPFSDALMQKESCGCVSARVSEQDESCGFSVGLEDVPDCRERVVLTSLNAHVRTILEVIVSEDNNRDLSSTYSLAMFDHCQPFLIIFWNTLILNMCHTRLESQDDSDFFTWRVVFEGPADSLCRTYPQEAMLIAARIHNISARR